MEIEIAINMEKQSSWHHLLIDNPPGETPNPSAAFLEINKTAPTVEFFISNGDASSFIQPLEKRKMHVLRLKLEGK